VKINPPDGAFDLTPDKHNAGAPIFPFNLTKALDHLS
jgi:hypothetical protein